MRFRTLLFVAFCVFSLSAAALGAPFIVKDGKANAEIIIAEKPARAAKLGAQELQTYLQKISGAKLEIVTKPTGKPVKIYVGQSAHAPKIDVPKSDDGAYRIASGDDWLALMGYDEDFVPIEPWARNLTHWKKEKIHEWDKLTGAKWSNPMATWMSRNHHKELGIWRFDKYGSQSAVYAFLRHLGVRWYMPGELGEIVPRSATIELPKLNQTVRPDFQIRTMNFARYHTADADTALYDRRLGTNRVFSLMHHGIRYVTERQDQKKAHPEFFRVINGKRVNKGKKANACLSSEGLFKENVRFVQTIFDLYDAPVVSVMPHDGFTQICECPKCKGQATLDRTYSGWYSDYVWNYVCRIAKELAKTHPNKKIMCGAYSTYQLPPLKIDKLPSNVLVQITNGRPRWEMDDATHNRLAKLRKAWAAKTSNKLSISMNYPFTQRGEFRPCYFPHVIARSLKDTNGTVWREDLWLPEKRGMHKPGVNHLNAYVLSEFLWDTDQDVDALLAEYYRLFYGPAEKEMKAFIEYCEMNFAELTKSKEKATRALELFDTAKKRVGPDSVYGKRIALVDDYLNDLRKRRGQLSRGRGPVPEFRAYNFDNPKWNDAKKTFKLDGKLDEKFWFMRGQLKELVTGKNPKFRTRLQAVCGKDALYLGILCRDEEGKPAMITGTKNGDPAIWNGDHIEILIETDSHSYYQIVVNPAGLVVDLDRGAPKRHWFQWASKAEVGAHVGKDFWSLEVRIPYTSDTADPLHLVVGRKPKKDMPWYFNICRKRVRGESVELSAFSPTGVKKFHDVMKFGKLYAK
jgi:Domain of unknown function (DUF4838)